MSKRAPCLAEAVAKAYADPDCSSSSASPSTPNLSLSRKLRRTTHTTNRSVLSSLVLLLLALPIASALFDPGQSDPVKESEPPKIARKGMSSTGDSSLSLVTPKGHPISLHPGCRRTTDLFDNVCQNPWSPFSTWPRKKNAASHSELVICPIGEVSKNGEKERVFAITGTITLPESTFESVEASSSSARIASLGDNEPHWPKPGDEGFWRQRDGELEWAPTEVRALLESDVTPAKTVRAEGGKDDVATPDAAHAEEYDAWSASIGGEDSKTWLSFEQWRESYLAAEREQEKQKSAAGRKQKAEKAKEKKVAGAQAGNATERMAEGQSQTTIHEANPTNINRSSTSQYNMSASSDIKQTTPSQAHLSPLPETSDEKQAESLPDSPSEEVVEPSVVKADTSQDTGAIPAVGNPSSQLSTLKHRWNFASFDCAAVVHRANPSAKFTSAILSEKKDRYMLSPCPDSGGDQQFVVVELCDEISVDTIVLANYEFFSRMFKRFRVRVSRNLNGGDGDWYDIGTFRARNVRGLQVFNTNPPTADSRFFRYVRIDFLEHYGSEYYCPISLLRVYGLTQMDDYIREEEEMKKQREAELTLADSESNDAEEDEDEAGEEVLEVKDPESVPLEHQTPVETRETDVTDQKVDTPSITAQSLAVETATSSISSSVLPIEPITSTEEASPENTSTPIASSSLSSPSATIAEMNATETASSSTNASLEQGPEMAISRPLMDVAKAYSNASATEQGSQPLNVSTTNATASLQEAASTNSSALVPNLSSNNTSTDQTPAVLVNSTASAPVEAKERAVNASTSVLSSAQTPTTESSKPAAAANQQQQHHGGSESIYRTITKRLNTLEMNATLSLQYMEHSRQQLREVFGRMERNQRDRMAEMLQELNASNWRQIESLKRRQQVDLQQAIFEFDKHRQQTDSERRALLAQVRILSNEVMLEKRFGIAQLVLLLGLFVFMAMTRGSRAAPLLHQGIARISRASPLVRGNSNYSPSTTIRGSPINQRQISDVQRPRSSSLETPRQHHSRPSFSTPRVDKQSRGMERAVRLRGGSHSKSLARKSRNNSLLPLSPLATRSSISSVSESSHHRRSNPISLQGSSWQIPSEHSVNRRDTIRPLIKVDTSEIISEGDLETPIHRMGHLQSTFERESTPTNLIEARRQEKEAALPPPSISTMDESFGSDWGTERSDDESHTSYDWHDDNKAIQAVNESSASPPNVATPTFNGMEASIHPIEESDAEEDSSPAWNSVKNRRSLKRPTSSGSWHANNGQSRIHTPTNNNLSTNPRRSFSPFHKNAEIEIN